MSELSFQDTQPPTKMLWPQVSETPDQEGNASLPATESTVAGSLPGVTQGPAFSALSGSSVLYLQPPDVHVRCVSDI